MTAPVQKGTAMLLGIGSDTYSGHLVEETERQATAEVETIKNTDDETKTVIISDPGVRLTLNVLCESASTLATVKIADTVTVNAVAYRVEDVTMRRNRKVARGTLRLIKEASMSYT